MKKQHKAFSLLEAILIAAFLGVFAIIAVPRLNFAVVSKHKADGTAKKIVSDLRLARSLAISNAANNNEGFKLQMIGSEPYTQYKIENDDTEEIIRTYHIDSKVACTGGDIFIFGPLGNLKPSSDNQLNVSAEGKNLTINITYSTGAIKCIEN